MLGKRLINSNSAAAGGSCTTDTLQILGDTSCIAYYKMSDATDESGNFDGTPTSVNFNVSGKFGNAGKFNGSSSKIDIASIITGNNSFSVSMWLNPTAVNGSPFMMGSATTSQAFLTFITSSNQLNLGRWGDSLGSTSNGSVPLNTWTHIAISSNAGSVTVYVNGVSDLTFSTTYNISSSGTFFGYASTGNQYYNGSIDNVRIFNKALSSSEVTTLYNEIYCVPTIVGTDNFNSVIYTGTGSTQSITSLNFAPDFTWIKQRSSPTRDHVLHDIIRGSNKVLYSNLSNDQDTLNATYFTSFDSNGFTLGGDNYYNGSSLDYVAWNWYAPTAETNTSGTITSTIKKNVDAGFSIVKYTGNGSTTATIGTGLDKKVELVLIKNIDQSTVWSAVQLPEKKVGNLNNSNAMTFSYYLDGTTSSVLGFQAQNNAWNQSSSNHIAYCFHSVDGMSRVGSYVGTGASGNTIVTNFRPAFLMIKNATGGSSWVIFDNKRNPSNPKEDALFPNLSSAEYTFSNTGINFLSNGFSLISNPGETNLSNNNYIFLAIAEEVFNPNGLTRNATNPFGDASETNLYKFEDNATDSEGNNNGTESNVTYATGYIDKAAIFNGTSSVITTNKSIGGAFTISFWAKDTLFSTNYYLLATSTGGSTSGIVIGGANGSGTKYSFRLNQTSTGVFNFDSGVVDDSDWHHVVMTYDNTTSANSAKIYINGSLNAQATATGTNAFSHTYNLVMMRDPSNPANYAGKFAVGKLDQLRIFNRALDSGEALQLYNE